MLQTGYKGFTTLAKGLPYNGGFCKWYYADKAQLLHLPAIDPFTQYLKEEPPISGSWFGPVQVPNDQLGFEETPKRDSAGLYWQHKITGFHVGDNAASRINIENMHFYEFIVVGKMRAGGMYLLIGTPDHGLQFDAAYSSDGKKAAGNNFTFTANLLNKAFVLPAFSLDKTLPPSDDTGNSDNNMNKTLVFPFDETQTGLQVDWTAENKATYGLYPLIEVWYSEAGELRLYPNPVITVDAFPPQTTKFTITLNMPGPGVIIFK